MFVPMKQAIYLQFTNQTTVLGILTIIWNYIGKEMLSLILTNNSIIGLFQQALTIFENYPDTDLNSFECKQST